MNILVFSGYYLPGYKGGGPIKTIKNLFDSAGDDVCFKLITSDRDLGDEKAYRSIDSGQWTQVNKASVYYVKPGVIGLFKVFRILKSKNYDLVYLNSFFSLRFSIFPLILSKIFRMDIVLGPRGEFSQGALSIKSFKKNIFINIFKFLSLHKGIVFQASSVYEKKDILSVLGEDVDICIAEDIGAQEISHTMNVRSDNYLKIVFVSRISPKKNLLVALEMLKSVNNPLEYHIYGPIEDVNYWKICVDLISELPSHIKVEYLGTLLPEQVVSTLSKYDAFYFPTAGENYGHVIAEALCAGLPLVIANTTPWRNLEEQGIGWDLALDQPTRFSEVLDKLALMPADQHIKMRENILHWSNVKFSQRDAIEANIAMFRYAISKK